MRSSISGFATGVLVVVAGAIPCEAAAQGIRLGLTGSVSLYETRRIGPDGPVDLTGPVAGGEGAAALGPVVLRAGYAEGWLDGEPGTRRTRNFVEGYALLGAIPIPGLEISVGPHARALGIGDDKHLSWFGQARVQYEAPIIPSFLHGYLGAWVAALGETDPSRQLSSWHGGAAGLTIRPTGGRLLLRIVYHLDEAQYDADPLRHTANVLTFTFGYGLQ